MFVHDVYMKNFGNVQEQYLDFKEGMTLFSGNNGEGKSTVLKCLSLLLFNQNTGKLSDYIRWGSDEFFISSLVSHAGKTLNISFKYSEKASNREVEDLDTKDKYQNSAATAYLDELFDTKRAIASIISFENEIDLITTSPSERREYLKRIYDLNFKEELNSINLEKISSEKEAQILSGEISTLESMTFDRLVLERLPFSEEVYNEKKETLKALRESLSNLQRQKDEISKNEKKKEILEFDIYKADKKVSNQNELINSQTSEKLRLEQEKESLTLDISSIEESKRVEKESLSDRVLHFEISIESLEKDLASLVEPTLDIESLEIPKLREESFSYQYKIQELEKQIKTFESGVCPTCGHTVDSSFLESSKKELESLRALWEKSKKSLKEKEEEKSRFLNEQRAYNESSRKISEYIASERSSLEKAKQILDHVEEKYTSKIELETANFKHKKSLLSQKIEEIKSSIESAIQLKESFMENRQKLSDDLQKVEDELSISSNINYLLEEQRSLVSSVETLVTSYDKTFTSNEEKKNINESQEKKQTERDEKLLVKRSELIKAQERVALTEFASKILSREFPSFVISRMISSLTFYVNEFLSKVYPNYDIEIVESKNSLRVLYGPNRSDVKLASGFEQQIFSFAWKYALGKIQNYGLLILDEVDSAASSENSEKFYSTLAKMDSCFKQIFIVTHKQEIKDLLANDFDASVYEVYKGEYKRMQ
jgi:DNA repair exonuclease SbcCD ATPase subunit